MTPSGCGQSGGCLDTTHLLFFSDMSRVRFGVVPLTRGASTLRLSAQGMNGASLCLVSFIGNGRCWGLLSGCGVGCSFSKGDAHYPPDVGATKLNRAERLPKNTCISSSQQGTATQSGLLSTSTCSLAPTPSLSCLAKGIFLEPPCRSNDQRGQRGGDHSEERGCIFQRFVTWSGAGCSGASSLQTFVSTSTTSVSLDWTQPLSGARSPNIAPASTQQGCACMKR